MKNCPFCGGEPSIYVSHGKNDLSFFYVKCNDCGARTRMFTEKNIWRDFDPDGDWDYVAVRTAVRNWERRV